MFMIVMSLIITSVIGVVIATEVTVEGEQAQEINGFLFIIQMKRTSEK